MERKTVLDYLCDHLDSSEDPWERGSSSLTWDGKAYWSEPPVNAMGELVDYITALIAQAREEEGRAVAEEIIKNIVMHEITKREISDLIASRYGKQFEQEDNQNL